MTSTTFALGDSTVIMENVSFPLMQSIQDSSVQTATKPKQAVIKCKNCICTSAGCVCSECEIRQA
jgi:hypothetical protein